MDTKSIPPLSFPRSLLYLGLPFLLMTLMFWGLAPLMDLMGVRLFITFLVALGVPLLLLFLLSFRFYRKEGHPWNRQAFLERFRLRRIRPVDWIWTIGLAAFMFGSIQLLSFTYTWIADFFPEPKILIRMFEKDPNYFMDLSLKGNWFILAGMLGFLACNVLGEEFWWRGYILPRQELVYGKWTWLVHGFLWNAFHLFMPWQQIQMLPASLALPFVAQRLRNTWPGIIAHFAVHIPFLWMLISRI
ncbi:CPBP family intramembrane metalloprotease [bacterium]|nr:CPBP family intramembrane metalloprotease [bacterium]